MTLHMLAYFEGQLPLRNLFGRVSAILCQDLVIVRWNFLRLAICRSYLLLFIPLLGPGPGKLGEGRECEASRLGRLGGPTHG